MTRLSLFSLLFILHLAAPVLALPVGNVNGFDINGHMIISAHFLDRDQTSEEIVQNIEPNRNSMRMQECELDLTLKTDYGALNLDAQAGLPEDGLQGESEFELEQAFFTRNFGKFSLKAGVFDSPIGVEALELIERNHISHGFTYAIEPKNHTGLELSHAGEDWQASLILANGLGVGNGNWGNTMNPDVNNKPALAFRAQANITGRLSASLAYATSDEGFADGHSTDASDERKSRVLSMAAKYGTSKWHLILEHVTLKAERASTPLINERAIALFAGWKLSDKLTLSWRYSETWGKQGGRARENAICPKITINDRLALKLEVRSQFIDNEAMDPYQGHNPLIDSSFMENREFMLQTELRF